MHELYSAVRLTDFTPLYLRQKEIIYMQIHIVGVIEIGCLLTCSFFGMGARRVCGREQVHAVRGKFSRGGPPP